MHKDVEDLATKQGIDTAELFEKAYEEHRGFLWGLKPPAEIHRLWLKHRVSTPPYVLSYLRKHLVH